MLLLLFREARMNSIFNSLPTLCPQVLQRRIRENKVKGFITDRYFEKKYKIENLFDFYFLITSPLL